MTPLDLDIFNNLSTKGYFILKNIIPLDVIASMKSKCEQEWDLPGNKIPQKNRSNKWLVMPELLDTLFNPSITNTCENFLGLEWKWDHIFFLKSTLTREKIAETGSIYDLGDLHGGPFSNGGTNFFLKNYPQQPFPRTGRLNIGITMTPSNHKTGGPQILPGSHLLEAENCYFNKNGTGGMPLEWYKKWQETNEILIPELEPGDVLFFLDACIHGTSLHAETRYFCYAMATPGFVRLVEHHISAAKWHKICRTPLERNRFEDAFYFKIFPGGQRNRRLRLKDISE